jgi:hypothetical protein
MTLRHLNDGEPAVSERDDMQIEIGNVLPQERPEFFRYGVRIH